MQRETWISVASFLCVLGMHALVAASTGTAMDEAGTPFEGLIDMAAWWGFSAGVVYIIFALATYSAHGPVFVGAVVLLIVGGLVATRNEWKGFAGMVEGATLIP